MLVEDQQKKNKSSRISRTIRTREKSHFCGHLFFQSGRTRFNVFFCLPTPQVNSLAPADDLYYTSPRHSLTLYSRHSYHFSGGISVFEIPPVRKILLALAKKDIFSDIHIFCFSQRKFHACVSKCFQDFFPLIIVSLSSFFFFWFLCPGISLCVG